MRRSAAHNALVFRPKRMIPMRRICYDSAAIGGVRAAFTRRRMTASGSLDRLRNRKDPRPVQDFLARLVHARRVVPPFADRQTVHTTVLAAAEMDGEGPVIVRPGRDVVEAVGTQLVFIDKAVGIVDGDRPEGIDRDVFHGYRMRASVILSGAPNFIERACSRQPTPSGSGPDKMIDRVGVLRRASPCPGANPLLVPVHSP